MDLRPVYAQAGTVPPSATVPVAPAAPAPGERPLMTLLGKTPAGDFLHRYDINVYGWIEGSYTYNFDNPPRTPSTAANPSANHLGRLNIGRQFDIEDEDFLVNQLDLTVERKVDLTSHQFEVGGRIDFLYGTDARFIHSNGMFDDVGYPNGPQYQFDIPQLYADIAVPVGNGLRIRVGKFEFFKPIDPNASAFYSHTFLYSAGGQSSSDPRVQSLLAGSALPFTLTGVSGFYPVNKQLSVELGISRGWDQSLEDNNGAIDAFGRINYALSGRTKLSFAFVSGPEVNFDNSHYRTVGDLSLVHTVNDQLAVLFDAVYGVQARPGTFIVPAVNPVTHQDASFPVSSDAHWEGISGNVVYRVNKYVSAAGRLEWYRDEEGFTTGQHQTLYEATVGLTISPFPDSANGAGFKVRPELRYDYCDHRYFEFLTRHHQLTAAVDAIYNF